MYSLVTLLSSVAIASASICCIPPQWEGQVGLLYGMVRNGKVEYSRGSALMAYDGVRRLIGQREYMAIGNNRQSSNIDVLLDFNTDTKYIRKGSECVKTKLNRAWDPGCIPDNATTIGTHAQLGYGGNMLSVDSYRIDAGGIQISLSVTTTGCIPVLESFRGSLDGVNFMQSMGFVNISAGLSDPTELNSPPTGCENAQLVEAHYSESYLASNIHVVITALEKIKTAKAQTSSEQGAFHGGAIGKRSIFGIF